MEGQPTPPVTDPVPRDSADTGDSGRTSSTLSDATSEVPSDTGGTSRRLGVPLTVEPIGPKYSQQTDSTATPEEPGECRIVVKRLSPDLRRAEPASNPPIKTSNLPGNHSDDSIYTKDIDLQMADGCGNRIRRRAVLDTGASVNVMARDVQEDLGYQLEPFDGYIRPFNSDPIQPLGVVRGVAWNFRRQAKTFSEEFYVFDTDQFDTLIGKPFIKANRLYEQNPGALSLGVG
ncbi:MAG: hypothetical protein M1813_005220 [Trichoglossum hirsutum]|nr:MAG: hypothetical protein M1813_005220 [Trichoglossum hirsutum]